MQTEPAFGVNYYIPCRNVSSKHQHPTLVFFQNIKKALLVIMLRYILYVVNELW